MSVQGPLYVVYGGGGLRLPTRGQNIKRAYNLGHIYSFFTKKNSKKNLTNFVKLSRKNCLSKVIRST